MAYKGGKPIQIVVANGGDKENSIELVESALSKILMEPATRNKKVVVVSVVGTFRKGKSFLLDFFLRYMYSKDKSNWLGNPHEPLTGFHWRGGADRDTTGIHIWSEPFFVKLPSGEEAAVLFLDTQGSFDCRANMKQSATIFALSTMLSSKEIFNVKDNLQEDYLQHLQFFTEYGRIALEAGYAQTPFQHLEFLVRDWAFAYEHPYGSKGGMDLLNKRLEVDDDMPKENISLRSHIKSCFSDLQCYLMPHPGLTVANSPTFNGRLADIDPTFVKQLQDYVPHILSPLNLTVKSINGQAVTCCELMEYFRAYVKIFQSGELPQPVSMYAATAEVNNLNACNRSRSLYAQEMNMVCGPRRPFVSSRVIEEAHQRCQDMALKEFRKTPKMGGEDLAESFEKKLVQEIDELYNNYKMSNQNKNTIEHFKTPMVLLIGIFIFYVVTGFLDAIGLALVSNVLVFPFWSLLIALGTWIFVRCTGSGPEVGEQIDRVAQGIIDNVFVPTVAQVGQKVVEKTMGVSPQI
ncbi:Atlastin-2 [Taenia solium]|eukprot:TsM_000486500 transcript=TsM_000486500 gene=TsM_000486500